MFVITVIFFRPHPIYCCGWDLPTRTPRCSHESLTDLQLGLQLHSELNLQVYAGKTVLAIREIMFVQKFTTWYETSALKQQHWWKELKFYIQLVIYCKGKYSYSLSTRYNFSPLELYFSCPFKQKAMLGYVYLPFIVILIGAIVFIFFKVPETKNRTFDEIAATITRGRKAKAPFDDSGEEMQKMNS